MQFFFLATDFTHLPVELLRLFVYFSIVLVHLVLQRLVVNPAFLELSFVHFQLFLHILFLLVNRQSNVLHLFALDLHFLFDALQLFGFLLLVL